MNYYSRIEVSNSDLGWLKNQLHPRDMPNPEKAYKFGTLFDCMITENHRVDYFNYRVDEVQYDKTDFEMAERMKVSLLKDKDCASIVGVSTGQAEMQRFLELNNGGVDFRLNTRCKWDLWIPTAGWGADLKSTTAETQHQFEQAALHFDYDRQRAWYMDIADSHQDLLIGVSKKNYKVFKIPITRYSDFYRTGKNKYRELAYRWWLLFGEDKSALIHNNDDSEENM